MKSYCSVVFVGLLSAFAGHAADAPVMTPATRAQVAAREFGMALKSSLSRQVVQVGPAAAIDFCHEEAPKIARDIAAEYGVRIGRVPVPGRQRSPANTPDAWQAEVLTGFQRAVAAGGNASEQEHVQAGNLPDNVVLRMMRGVAVEPLCLLCHGKALAPEVTQAIARYYPQDTATGFDVGDLRGAVWVEVPAANLKE
ncbi:MAG: DUF3365 domain-containing protein [Steroidobacteraceae bacterium]